MILGDITDLDLRQNKLDALPPEIGYLANLQVLTLHNNLLKTLPKEIGTLTKLSSLSLYSNMLENLPVEFQYLSNISSLVLVNNMLKSIPDGIVYLPNLSYLDLRNNQLYTLHPELHIMTSLTELKLDDNYITELPESIDSLTDLEHLSVRNNKLAALPKNIGKLVKLSYLDIRGNQIATLPKELAFATSITKLDVDKDTLVSPPPEVMMQGVDAIRSYLRAQLEDAEEQWISKLLVVGEGGVGKTSLLRSLRGEAFDNSEVTTHGISIQSVSLKHPTRQDVEMTLRAWDFGGQEIYHATHQFFLTNRSVFVLVWNARLGFEQGRLYYWLDLIRALAPDSPVLIVATHVDERSAELPIATLQKSYPNVQGHWLVSNQSSQGIEAFRVALAGVAASLPLMGEIWPGAWLRVANTIRAQTRNYVTVSELYKVMSTEALANTDRDVLARWLHELGDILFFPDDEELKDTVVLKPEWVTRSISTVLESEEIARGLGIFTREEMDRVWQDVSPDMHMHLLRLMERFDLSYRTLEDREVSIVVERLSQDPPDNHLQEWNGHSATIGTKKLSMHFRFGSSLPPGMPTWFIARSHRFTTHTHWRYGAVFAHRAERTHLALLEAKPHDRAIELTVIGQHPQNFFALMREGLELTIRRFPGMKVGRAIPCPCRKNESEACGHEFDLAYLERAAEQEPPVVEVQCQRSFRPVSLMGLLFGIHWRIQDKVLDEIVKMRGEVHELIELSQREFLNLYRRDQSTVDLQCPNIFTLRPIGPLQTLTGSHGHSKNLFYESMELQLYCQAPGHWHPTDKGGRYLIKSASEWLITALPYLQKLLSILKISSQAKLGVSLNLPLKDIVPTMHGLVKHFQETEEAMSIDRLDIDTVDGASLRVLHKLLDGLDESHEWGNLRPILTPEGHYLWLCEQHAGEYIR